MLKKMQDAFPKKVEISKQNYHLKLFRKLATNKINVAFNL